jgi:hypothetical protein
MISKLLIVDVNVSDEVKSLLEVLKEDSVLITYYDYSEGFIVNEQNLLVDKLLALIRSHLETTTVNFEHLCFINVEQMNTPMHSFKYNNQAHMISGIESKPEELESWNFMGKLVADIAKTTEIRNIDFIDIDHLCFPKEHALIFDKIQEVTKDVEERVINYLKVAEDDKETIYNSENWLHTMLTTFYSDENKVLIDKYFKVNNSNIGFLNTKTMKPRNLQIYESHAPNIDFESGELNVSIIPLHSYENETDYNLMEDFIKLLNSNTIVEFVYITDTMEDFTDRLTNTINKYCGGNKDKINKVNVGFWLNPNISNPSLMLSNHISANIDQELVEVVNQLMTNNTENVEQLKNHFVVQMNEALIDIFNMNVYDNMDVNTINFEIFNISDTFNTNYNLLCQFLHNDYYVSTLVNFNLTFLSSSDNSENLFELHNKIEEFDEYGVVIDVSYDLFKDSQLMADISNNEAYQEDLFISNISHTNKSIQYNNDVNMAVYLKSDGPEIDKFMKPNIITNVILYDRELNEHLADVRGCLLPNTLLLTFDKQNTYQDIKDGLLRINELNGVQISNVALFQDNKSMSKTYNLVNEESSIIKYPRFDDPSLNSWTKFQDFVTFLDSELGVKHFDLMMCKIYSNPNWNYVIDAVSSNLSSLVIRSSENNTGHTMFEGDWILESPLVDVNMIHLYFKESIKELEIQLGDMGENGEKYFNKFTIERTSSPNQVRIREIQVWIYGKNVALNTNGGVASASSNTANASKVNDNHASIHDGHVWHPDTTNNGEYVTVTLAQPYLVWDIEAVTIYFQEDHTEKQQGCRLALYNDNELVSTLASGNDLGTYSNYWGTYQYKKYVRIDGYSIGNVTNFSNNWSGYEIIIHNASDLKRLPYSGSSRTSPTAPEGYFYPKLTDSDANDISYVAQYTDNGKQYVSYAWSSNATINIDYDLRKADFMILAGGGAGQGGRWGGGGGGGGIVIGREIDIVAGEYNIVVGAGGTATSNENTSSPGENSEAFGYVALGGGGGGNSVNSDYADGGSGGGFGDALGFHSDTGTFVITGGSANYNNDSSNYPNVLVHGYPGGTTNTPIAPGGGSGASAGGNSYSFNGYQASGHGAVGMKNNFYDGVDFRYGAGGGGGAGDTRRNEGQGGGGGYGTSWNTGGGGDGGLVNHNQNFASEGQDATPNTGSGGGGASTSGHNRVGGNGSNGMVILRFALDDNEHLPQAAAVASDVADYSTKFYNYNTGEALAATEEQVVVGSIEPKLMDSNGDELSYNTYTENSIEYKSYVFTTVGTTSVSLSHDTPVDFMVVAGGGGGGAEAMGPGGGAGGVVIGTQYSLSSGSYDIKVGDGGKSRAHYNRALNSTEIDTFFRTPWQPYLTTDTYNSIASWGQNWATDGEESFIQGTNHYFSAIGGGGGRRFINSSGGGSSSGSYGNGGGHDWPATTRFSSEPPLTLSHNALGYSSTDDYFIILNGSSNYNNDSTTYPNVMVYGNIGGGGTNLANGGGGGAGGPGTNGGEGSGRQAGHGGVGIENNFADGTSYYYAGGGAGGVHNSDDIGTGGLGGGGNSEVSGTANTGGGGGGHSTQSNSPEGVWGSGMAGNGGSGIVVIRFPKTVNEYETKATNTFTESTTAYLNYDISGAEIKKYVDPSSNNAGDISSQVVNLDAGVYNVLLDKPVPPSPPVKYVVFQRISDNLSRETSIGEIECVLNDDTNVALATNGATAEIYEDFSITDNVASWSTVSTFMASWTNGNYWADKAINGTTSGNGLHINHWTELVSTVITLQDTHALDTIHHLYVRNNQSTDYLFRITEHRFVLLDEDKNVVATTDEITVGEVDITFNYSEFNLIGSTEVVDVSTNIVVDTSTNTITSNVVFEIKYTPVDVSLSELTKDTTINPVRSQTIPFVKSNGNQEERSVTLHGDATYNRFSNEYYFPGDLSGYASIEGQLFGEHAMSMSFMYKSGGEQPILETNDASMARNTIAYIGYPYPSPLNQNAHDTNDFAIYSSPNDQASIFYKEDDTSIKEVPTTTFDNSSNYTHIAITMNEDLTLNETNGFKLYVDGTLTKSGNLSANNGALISGVSQPLQLLGKGPLAGSSQSSAFKGYLKNVRFYDHVLSQSQVSTIYTNMITNEYTDNKNFVSQVVPNLVISSSDISSGDHTELTSITMNITSNETITKKEDPNEVVVSPTFKYVVLQRNSAPQTYQASLVPEQVSLTEIVEIECFVNSNNVLLSSNGTNAIWSRDFVVNDNVANVWSDAGESVRYWSWALSRVPNNAINGNSTRGDDSELAWAHHDDALNPPTNAIHWIATLASEQSLDQVDYVKLYNGSSQLGVHSEQGDLGYRIAGTRFLFLNDAREVVAYTGEITTGVYEHTFNAADITTVGPEVITVENPSLAISPDDINVVNGVISDFKNSSQYSMSFTFTPTSSNIKSSVSISENSILNKTIENMTDKPSWFTNYRNNASNVFEFMRTNVEMDLMPPLQNQTIAMITSNGSHVEIPVTLNGGVVYDASKNEYDISENGYLSIDEDVIRDGDLTISLMYAMRSGNQYGNDQLVNFSDTNSLNTSTDSTDIHIFRDGTTPGAWFYYGSPDDNGMAISEAGLEPSLVNTQVTQSAVFDSTDLQMEYIANTTATSSTWTSIYTNNSGNATTHATGVPSGWQLGNDSDGEYYLLNNHGGMTPNYPNKTYLLEVDTAANMTGFTYELWIKNSNFVNKNGWLIGIDTGFGPFLTLNDSRVGGIGMLPGASDNTTYGGLTNPGYITSKSGELIHLIGYMYMDSTGTYFNRGIWINGTHYPQETTQQAKWNNDPPDLFPRLDGGVTTGTFVVGNNLPNTNDTNSASGIKLYSFRNWHRQLTGDEVAKLYSWGPQGSVISPPEITTGGLTPKYTHMAITVKEGQVKRFYINGEVVDYVNKYRSNAIPVSRPIVGGKRQYQLFGYGYAANRGFSGLMKNIRIYNKALTSYEMRHLYAINSKFNDNDFSNTTLIPVPRPTLTFSAPLPESKILDSNGSEMTFNSFVKNGKQYKAYSFTNTGTTSITLDNDATEVEILIVGGGGAGAGSGTGAGAGGGGGGGGVVYVVNQKLTAGNYNIVVGEGGVATTHSDIFSGWPAGSQSWSNGENGDNSEIQNASDSTAISLNLSGVTASAIGYGGGAGGTQEINGEGTIRAGEAGGSGGGSGGKFAGSSDYPATAENYIGGASTQGNTVYDVVSQTYIAGGNDGNGTSGFPTGVSHPQVGGGGGGAGGTVDNTNPGGLDGQDGVSITINNTIYEVGGGGGGSQLAYNDGNHGSSNSKIQSSYSKGGLGGGGNGLIYYTTANAIGGNDGATVAQNVTSGTANSGGGGGAFNNLALIGSNFTSHNAYSKPGNGGSGIVIIQFPKAEVASGSSLEQPTLDLTLTASDDGLDGNITASDIITSNGTITAFSQSSPTTWDLTFTSDYNKQSNVGSLFIEQDTIYNKDVSDAFDQYDPIPSWWTREHNKASNKFEWTALNSGASDTSADPTRPSITFSSPDLNHGESQNLGTISMTIYVSSNNLTITQTDLSFSNGVVSDFTKVANNYYTFNFKSASVSQPSIIEILQDTVSNAETSNDFNEASNTFEWTWGFTVTAPDVTITSSDVTHGGNFGGQQVNMILEFSSEVLHGNSVESTFSQFDVSATNGYVFDVSIISQSQIAFKLGSSSITESTSVFIPQNIITRTYNDIYTVNSNNTSNVFTWSYDSADLTISSLVVNDANGNPVSAGDNINKNQLWLQFTFSESIYNFDKSYFNVTNCKITNISTDTTFTTFTIKTETYFPTSAIIELQSNKLITTGRGLQKYITGTNNLSFNWNYDNTRPKISMTSSQVSGLTNNVSFVDLSFVSTMDTSDFTESSIVVTGDASLSNFTAISATEYSVRVTPNSVTSINITVPENAYTEQYGNGNENSVSFNWNYDNIPPTVEIFSPDIANGASSSDPYINIYFTISKPVDDFVLSDDANVANGTLGVMTKTNTFVNHTTNFTVTVASKTASHPYDSSGSSSGYFLNGVESPTIDFIVGQTYTFDQSDSTNTTHPLRFYTTAEKDQIYTSDEVVYTDNPGTNGAITTITIDENTPSPLYYQCLNHGYMGFKGEVSKKESYTAKLYPTQNDTVSIFIFADSITDSAGNTNTVDSNEFDWIFDSNDLLATLSSSDVTNNGTFANDSITLSLATTSAIVDFVEADISYENGTISNVDSSAKTFTITSNTQGVPTSAFIIGGAVETSLGEPNIESNLFTWTYNPPIPKLVITSSQINEGDYTNISSIDFILTFDQAAVVFDQNSLVISNGTIAAFSGSGTTYQVTVTPSVNEGIIMLTLPQGGAYVVDNGNHENDVSYNFEWNYDSIVPAITIGSSILSDGDVTNLTSLSLTVTSSETINGLSLSDFDVSNAVVSNLSDTSGSSFTLTIQPLDDTTDCSINIFLKDDSVTDRASNTNSQSNTFAFSYEFFSRKQDSGTIADIFENDAEIPAEDRLSSSDIDLVISAAFTIPDTASPFAVAATENSNAGGNNNNNNSNNNNNDNNDTANTTTRNPTFVKPPKITIPPAIKIKNRKVFTKLIDQIFATASESVKTLTIDKSSVAVTAAAEEQIAEVEEVVMVKSNQTEPVDMSTLVEDPTKPSATYIPLANVGDFAIVAIDGVEYTTVVDGEGIFALSSNNGGVIANPGNIDGKWRTNDVYQATDINKIIFGSQIISTDPVAPEPPTLTITSGQVSSGGTTDISYIDLSFVFSTTVEISLNSIEPLNADTTIISRTIESIDSSNSYISVTAAPVDASANNTIGVFVDVSAFYDTNNTFNDVQYTYSWNYSLDGGGSGTGQFVPCFLEGTQILTTNGYKNIELLDPKKDKLLDKDNKPLNFLDIQKYSQENNGNQYPYKIPSGSKLSAEYICNRDLYLTYNHCVYLPHLNKYAPVSAMKHLKEDRTMTQKKFTYYHIFTENYFSDTLMANGIPCESHSKYTFEKLRNIDPSCKLLKNVIKKAEMLPNCMRNRLSIKETKQMIKKFQSKQNKKKTKQVKKK